MNTHDAAKAGPFRAAYSAALEEYLRDPSEGSLRVAYELGREAVSRQMSVLDLALAHHEALTSALAGALDPQEMRRSDSAAGDFFLESLSTIEMVQRGLGEARDAALLERRQTEMSRQLSSFLADASLVLDASDSLEEMLQLVAEQARELVDASCCLATIALEGQVRSIEGASYSDTGRRWMAFIRWLDLPAVYRLIRLSGGSTLMESDELSQLAPFRLVRRTSTAAGLAGRVADRPRRQRAGRRSALRQARRPFHRVRPSRPRPPRPDGVGDRRACPALPGAKPRILGLRQLPFGRLNHSGTRLVLALVGAHVLDPLLLAVWSAARDFVHAQLVGSGPRLGRLQRVDPAGDRGAVLVLALVRVDLGKVDLGKLGQLLLDLVHAQRVVVGDRQVSC